MLETYINRVGLIFHREDTHPPESTTVNTAIAKVIPRRSIDPTRLPHLQVLEMGLRFLPPLFAIAKALVVILGFSKSRRILCEACRSLLGLRHARGRRLSCVTRPPDTAIFVVPKEPPPAPQSPVQNRSANTKKQNHTAEQREHIPLSALQNNFRSGRAATEMCAGRRHNNNNMERQRRRYEDAEIEELSV